MDTKKRSWIKSVTWRIVGVVILGAITYLVTWDWGKTTGITAIFHGVRLVLYYWHERLWERIDWGKVRHPLSHLPMREGLTADDVREIAKLLEEKAFVVGPPEYEI